MAPAGIGYFPNPVPAKFQPDFVFLPDLRDDVDNSPMLNTLIFTSCFI